MERGSASDYSNEDNSDQSDSEKEQPYGASDSEEDISQKVAEFKDGARLREQVKATDIHTAVWQNEVAIVEKLLEMDRSLATERDATDFGENFQPLHYAAYQGHLQLVEMLCLKGGSVNAQTDGGCTPLYFAAQQGHVDCVEYLLNQNADIALCEKEYGFNAVDVGRDNRQVLEVLKKHAGTPLRPSPPRIGRVKATALEVFYEPLATTRGELPVKSYKIKVVKITEDAEEGKAVEIAVIPPETNPAIIKGLAPETHYKVQISAVNSLGYGSYSDSTDTVQTMSVDLTKIKGSMQQKK